MFNVTDDAKFLVPDLFTANELFVLAAPPQTGKSTFTMELSRAVASGDKFLGRPCAQGGVIYVCGEDSEEKIKERAIRQSWEEGLPIQWMDTFRLSETYHLEEQIEALAPRLVVIDTLTRSQDSMATASSAEVSQTLEPLHDMAMRYSTCIVVVHHIRTVDPIQVDSADMEYLFEQIGGSSAIRAVCRGALVMAKGTNGYRLVTENGWGKHDLKLSLDTRTLRWKLNGKWNSDKEPPANDQQR